MKELKDIQNKLAQHEIYKKLSNIDNLRTFMSYHVFAVFDFMSLLKSLQNKIAPSNNIWIPSSYDPQIVRFINEIVLGEESDLTPNGHALSHFELYIEAMKQLRVETKPIDQFVSHYHKTGEFSFEHTAPFISEFVSYNLHIAQNGTLEEVLGAFLFGREKLIPNIFTPILSALSDQNQDYSMAYYYFKRHIEIDGDEHGPMAQLCFESLCKTTEQKELAFSCALQALKLREQLWDNILIELN